MKSISLPASVLMLQKDWYIGSSLCIVVVESGKSLQIMIEGSEVDLEGDFDTYLVELDGAMIFHGFSVSVIPGVDSLVRLVKKK
jgi:hypothetical protein